MVGLEVLNNKIDKTIAKMEKHPYNIVNTRFILC